MATNKQSLIDALENLLAEIEAHNLKKESLEWYLKNNIIKFIASAKSAQSQTEFKSASQIFSRFCTESMDWDTEQYRRCIKLANDGLNCDI